MSDDQKKVSDAFPKFSPPPALPVNATTEQKANYEKAMPIIKN